MAHKKTLSFMLQFLFSAVSSNSALKSPLSTNFDYRRSHDLLNHAGNCSPGTGKNPTHADESTNATPSRRCASC